MQVTILGHSAGGPYHGRPFTSHVLHIGNEVILIDCGEGTQMQLFHHRVRYDACQHIFITHLHGDHVFGLMGLLTNWCLKKREASLHLYGPEGLQALVEHTAQVCGVRFPYTLKFSIAPVDDSAFVLDHPLFTVQSFPLHHRMPTVGWLFREKPRPRNMIPEKIAEYDIHFSHIPAIKSGEDFAHPDGRVIPNSELTKDPLAPRSYAFCSDTAPSDIVITAVQGVDLLYHEATFCEEHTEEAQISYHSTAAQAAQIAVQAGVGQLMIGHFSGRYADEAQHLSEARAVFQRTMTATPGLVVEVG
jgi:ribonuclease Z